MSGATGDKRSAQLLCCIRPGTDRPAWETLSQRQSVRVDWVISLTVSIQARWPDAWWLLISRERWEPSDPHHTPRS